MVPFVFTLLCQDRGQWVRLCQAKLLRRAVMAWGCETLLTASQKKTYPMLTAASGLTWWLWAHHTIPWCSGLWSKRQSLLGKSAVRTTAKPWVVCKTHLPEVQQVQQRSSGCIPYPVTPCPSLRQLGGLSAGEGDAGSLCSHSDRRLGAGWKSSPPSAWKHLLHLTSVFLPGLPDNGGEPLKFQEPLKCCIFCPLCSIIRYRLSFTAQLYVA